MKKGRVSSCFNVELRTRIQDSRISSLVVKNRRSPPKKIVTISERREETEEACACSLTLGIIRYIGAGLAIITTIP